MKEPLVSVVIATYNTGRYLPETIESALAQTHPRCDLIVVDDGSTDDTVDRLAPYHARIRLLRLEHRGLAAARNAGIAASRGDFIALLDADDLWMPEKLAVQLAVARRHPTAGLIVCDGVQFDGERILAPRLLRGRVTELLDASPAGEISGWYHRELIECTSVSCPAQTLIPKRVLERIGPFADSGAQDWDCNLRIAQRYPVAFHHDALVRWRYREDSMSGPQEGRSLRWVKFKFSVLARHATRCDARDRRLIRRQQGELVWDMAYHAYREGCLGDRPAARRELSRLLRARPWPPTALPFWIGLHAPEPLRKAVAGALRELRLSIPGAP